jgi:HEAT repeat protein
MREEDWPTTPEGIAALLARMDQVEPGWLSPEDDAAWRATLRAQKDVEKARFFEDADGSVRLQAAYALSRMGRQSLPARARLIGALEDSSRRVREWAAAALQGLEANSTP